MHAELLPTKFLPRTCETGGDMREQRQRQLSFIVETVEKNHDFFF